MDALKDILLIDDDEIEFMKVSRAFAKLGIKNSLRHKVNGLDAKKYLEETIDLPGLILLDLNMPKMNGIEFLEFIKGNDRLKKIPVVVLTTSNNEQDRMDSFNHSVAGYMIKPIRLEEYERVLDIVKNYWSQSKIGH